MRRIVLRTGRTALFGAFLLVAMLAFLPLRAVLGWIGVGDAGLTARQATGAVWAGRMSEAKLGPLPLGDLDAALSPFALFIGRARVALAGPTLHGAATISRHRIGIDEMTATLAAGAAFAPLPVANLSLDDVTVHFVDGACESAQGRVRATLVGMTEGVAVPPLVSGAIRCDGAALLLPLASQAGSEGITLHIQGDGRYRGELSLQPTDPQVAQKLALGGFTQVGNAYRLSLEGQLR